MLEILLIIVLLPIAITVVIQGGLAVLLLLAALFDALATAGTPVKKETKSDVPKQ